MNNLTKTAKTLDKVCHVAQVILTTAGIVAIICISLMLLFGAFGADLVTFSSGMNTVSFGSLKLELSEIAAVNHTLAFLQAIIVLAMACVCMFIGRQGCRYIRAILNPMTLGQPFDNAVSTNLNKLANLCIAAGIATNLTLIVEEVMTVFAYNLGDLMNPALVSHITISLDLDLTFLLYFGILRLLSYVFRYGQELQQLSDETL